MYGFHTSYEMCCIPRMDVIKDKEKLYRLIVGQLQYDGYVQVSKNLLQQGNVFRKIIKHQTKGTCNYLNALKSFAKKVGLETAELGSYFVLNFKLYTV